MAILFINACVRENSRTQVLAKSIMKNGGVLENEVVVDGVVEQRYWIECQGDRMILYHGSNVKYELT